MTGYVLEEKQNEKVDKSRELNESSEDTREIQTPDSPEIVKKRRPCPKSKIACFFLFSCGLSKYIHYDPLMMSQKESPRNHP